MSHHVFGKLSRGLIYALAFLFPLFFLPSTLDVLEVNKQTLLVLFALGAGLAWTGEQLMRKEVEVRRGWLNAPPVLLLLSVTVSAVLSQGAYLSFIGTASQEYMSVLTLVALTVLFYVSVNVLRTTESLRVALHLLLASALVTGIFGTLSVFGVSLLPFTFAKSQVFNTVGTVNSLCVYLAVMTVLGIGLWLAHSEKKPVFVPGIVGTLSRCAILLLSAVSFLLFLVVNYWIPWMLLLVGTGFLLSFVLVRAAAFSQPGRYIPAFGVALCSLLFVFLTPAVFHVTVPAEVTPNSSLSWEISKGTLAGSSALFGSGPGTFLYSYALFHSEAINETAFWNVRFDRASSFALTLLPTVGVLGVFFWMLFLVSLGGYVMRALLRTQTDRRDWELTLAIGASWLTLVAAAFLYPFNMTLIFLLFFLSALLSRLVMEKVYQKPFKFHPYAGYAASSVFLVTLFCLVFLIFVSVQRYAAEIAFAKAVRLDREQAPVSEIVTELDHAASLVRFNDIYQRNLAQALLRKLGEDAQLTSPDQGITPERGEYLQALTSSAIGAGVRATTLAPKNVLNWLVRAGVYRELIGLVADADAFAVAGYEEATRLEPANPMNYTELGETHLLIAEGLDLQRQSDDPNTQALAETQHAEHLSLAEVALLRAIKLKPDYSPAHYQLAIVYERQGRLSEAVGKMESVASYNALDIGVSFQLGLLYLRRAGDGDLARAQKAFEHTVYLAPAYSNARWYLASIYEQQGDFAGAIEQVETVLELNPDNATIVERLNQLRAGKAAAELPPPIIEPEPVPQP